MLKIPFYCFYNVLHEPLFWALFTEVIFIIVWLFEDLIKQSVWLPDKVYFFFQMCLDFLFFLFIIISFLLNTYTKLQV